MGERSHQSSKYEWNPTCDSRRLPYARPSISIIKARLLVPTTSIDRLHPPSHHPQPPLEIAPINSMPEVSFCPGHQQVSECCREPAHHTTALRSWPGIPCSWHSLSTAFRAGGRSWNAQSQTTIETLTGLWAKAKLWGLVEKSGQE